MTRAALVSTIVCSLMTMACYDHGEHTLARMGYGHDDWSRERFETLGIRGYILEQLDPESIPDGTYEAMESAYPVLDLDYRGQLQDDVDSWRARQQLARAKVLRATYSRRQLEAVLLDFWMNHFNVFAGGGLASDAIVPYERQHIAPHVLGRFEDLLRAIARSPAMLDYLDNNQNSRWGLNENYARELMELHTLGVDGPYTEIDVVEVARALTGWATDRDAEERADGYRYRDDWHDPDEKTVLGQTIPAGGGEQDGYDVLALLARHPSTAHYVSGRLARRFVSEEPSERLVERMAERWLETDGDLREVLKLMFLSTDFRLARDDSNPRVKRPLHLIASTLRALDASGDELAERMANELENLGEDPYMARPPTGYPEDSASWAGNGTMLNRINMLANTARGWNGIEFTPVVAGNPDDLVDAWLDRLFMGDVPGQTRNAAVAHLNSLPNYIQNDPDRASREVLAVLLASPRFLGH